MLLQPYLNFDGRCREAFTLYQQVLGGRIEAMIPFSETPAEHAVPAEARDGIMHACLIVGDAVLMASDAPPGMYEEPKGLFVSIGVEDPDEVERIFHALADGGRVTMPVEKTFWSERFGMVVDRFGIPWMVNCTAAVEGIEAGGAQTEQHA